MGDDDTKEGTVKGESPWTRPILSPSAHGWIAKVCFRSSDPFHIITGVWKHKVQSPPGNGTSGKDRDSAKFNVDVMGKMGTVEAA